MDTRTFGPLLLLLASSCGTMRNGRRWGEDATLLPGSERLGKAAHDAAVDPWTWVPLAGAGVLSISDWDQQLSEWARDSTPVFGSTQNAEDMGDTLRTISEETWVVSAIATPSGDEAGMWSASKLQGFAVQWSATAINSTVTSQIKDHVHRERPNGDGNDSFPSSGASDVFTYAALGRRNLDAIDMDSTARNLMQAGIGTVAAGRAWARVEAGDHYPTDVLFGAALGNFIGRFVNDAFLGLPDGTWVTAYVDPGGDAVVLGFSFRF